MIVTTKNCRRCQVEATNLSRAKDNIERLARVLNRCERPTLLTKYKSELILAKEERKEILERISAGHECDDLASVNHWSKTRTLSSHV